MSFSAIGEAFAAIARRLYTRYPSNLYNPVVAEITDEADVLDYDVLRRKITRKGQLEMDFRIPPYQHELPMEKCGIEESNNNFLKNKNT